MVQRRGGQLAFVLLFVGALLIFFTTGLQLMTRKDVPLKDSKSYRFTLFSALACCLSEMPDFRLAPGTLGIGERLQEMGGGQEGSLGCGMG